MLKKILAGVAVLGLLLLAMPLWIMWRDYVLSHRGVDTIRPADKAVVLATKAYENGVLNPCLVARIQAGVDLYRAGKVKKLVMSGGVNRDLHYGSQTMQEIAEKMGVPAADIEQEDQSADTFENIVFSRKFVEHSPRVVIVSAGFHLTRALWMADKQWQPKDIQVYAAPFCSEPKGGYAFSVVRETAAIVKNGLLGRY